jgi:15-hydroxyprostaglandin dehydrogenase (NAD)
MSAPVALVTGGGSGIGLALAEHLISVHGYKVAIADVVESRVREQATRLGTDNCLPLHLDVTDYDAYAQAFQQVFHWGRNRFDLAVLNAGIGDTDTLYKDLNIDPNTHLPQPLHLRVLDVNLTAVLQGIHLARHFFASKNSHIRGKIVATSSIAGLYPNHALPLYAASKHALVGLVRSLAPVYAKDQITINALLPTLIETSLMPEAYRPMWDKKQLTPMRTALKAMDMILSDAQPNGEIMELSLDEVICKAPPSYSRPNIQWVAEQHHLWELAMEHMLPRKAGDNAVLRQTEGGGDDVCV